MARQCELVGLARASYYYRPVGESAEELALLRLLDEQYTRTPFYGVHPTLVAQWKRQLREALPQVFADRRQKPDRTAEELQAQLYQQIGQLKVELDWLKKKVGLQR